MLNFIKINPNNIYKEIYEIIVDEELLMTRMKDADDIEKIIKNVIKNSKNIQVSEDYNNKDELLSAGISYISENTFNKDYQYDTIGVYGDLSEYYELVYCENFGYDIKTIEDKSVNNANTNEFATILNPEKTLIAGNIIIIKNKLINNKIENVSITKNDIANILIKHYYHTGVLICDDDSLHELTFTGSKPQDVIGSNFKLMEKEIECFGMKLLGYNEPNNNINKMASKIFRKELKGKLFITVLCPKIESIYWNISKEAIKIIYNLIENNKQIDNFNDDVHNPFFAMQVC